ncbi:DUF4198 domain-containing protein [Roseobacteraceae bacterium NS-SX3]
MPIRLLRLPALAGLLLLASLASAHEFWIEPEKYQVAEGAQVSAQLLNGQMFKGAKIPYFPQRTRRFEVTEGGSSRENTGRMGDLPALQFIPQAAGLLTIVHETEPDTLVYESWTKFQAFADEKGFAGIRARHTARGLPESGFTERYSRHAKALIAVGQGEGRDGARGMETEFVALANPYTGPAAVSLPVLLLYQDAPRPGARIDVFERTAEGAVTRTRTQTGADGIARITVKPGRSYLLDAVVLRPAPDGSGAVWETLWASLTFAIPPR